MLYTNSITHPKMISITNGNVDIDKLKKRLKKILILLTMRLQNKQNPLNLTALA